MSTLPSHSFPPFFPPEVQIWVPLPLHAKADYKGCSLCCVASEYVGITVSPRRQTVFSRLLKTKEKEKHNLFECSRGLDDSEGIL